MKTYSSIPAPGGEKYLHVPCNFCGSEHYSPYLKCEGFSFVRCRDCRLVYQYPQPDFSALKGRYKDNYFKYEIDNEAVFFNLMKLGLRDIDFDKLSNNYSPPRTFLDIGCATGMLLEHIRSLNWSVKGVDLCKESVDYGIKQRKLDIFAGPLKDACFSDLCFDVIHFSHLIEHVPDPLAFLDEVHRILKPGGIIIVTTPNVDGFQANLFRQKWRSAIADHLFLFSLKTLPRMMQKAGFVIDRRITWGGLAVGTAPAFIKKPIDRLAKKYHFGDVMLFLARKA